MDSSGPRRSPLDCRVLVLNRYYMAVHVINVRRAFALLCKSLAEVVHTDDGQYFNYDFDSWLDWSQLQMGEERHAHDDWVRSVNFEIQAPRIIRLVHYDRAPRKTLRFSRRNIFARDGYQCQYCGRSLPGEKLSFDHVVPRRLGGGTSWENVVSCCYKCNGRKGGRTPRQARMKLLRTPQKPKHNPLMLAGTNQTKYACWQTFLPSKGASLEAC